MLTHEMRAGQPDERARSVVTDNHWHKDGGTRIWWHLYGVLRDVYGHRMMQILLGERAVGLALAPPAADLLRFDRVAERDACRARHVGLLQYARCVRDAVVLDEGGVADLAGRA